MDPIERLTQAGLFGDSLVAVHTPELVDRYNDGLERLGIEPTTLTCFAIDGIGWSPQIAAQRGDDYLLAGPANPMGVIITPDQRGRPIYRPYSSFYRRMIDSFFENHHKAISDITSEIALGLDVDQELTTFDSARDLEMVQKVTVRVETNGLSEAAAIQKNLAQSIIKDENSWTNIATRQALIDSAKVNNDLRRRKFNIPEFNFPVKNFHTRAFGGVFVFRRRKGRGVILVIENREEASIKWGDGDYHLSDPGLLKTLLGENLIELELEWYRKHLDVLKAKKEGMAVNAILAEDPTIKLTSLTETQRKRLLAKAAKKLPTVYGELERFEQKLARGKEPAVSSLSEELKLLLYRPRQSMAGGEQVPIWQLLIRLEPLDVYRLYTSDKNLFFQWYKTWPEEQQAWAVQVLKQTYLPEKKHHKNRRVKNA